MMSEMTRLYEDNDLLVGRLRQMEIDLQVSSYNKAWLLLCKLYMYVIVALVGC